MEHFKETNYNINAMKLLVRVTNNREINIRNTIEMSKKKNNFLN